MLLAMELLDAAATGGTTGGIIIGALLAKEFLFDRKKSGSRSNFSGSSHRISQAEIEERAREEGAEEERFRGWQRSTMSHLENIKSTNDRILADSKIQTAVLGDIRDELRAQNGRYKA